MKAVRLYAARDLRVEDIDPPGPPAPGWVTLRTTAAGICGSDLHNYRTGHWISRSPSTAGHEFAGVVTGLGDGVTGLAIGDTVVADSRFWCGECYACKSGRTNVCAKLGFVGEVCDGGFAELATLPARLVHRHDPGLDPAIAAMAEPLAVALHAIRKQAVPSGQPVLVIGCGTIGGFVALLLSRLHEGPVLVADRNAERASLVADVTGAKVADLDGQSIRDALGGQPLLYACDATGDGRVLKTTLDLLSGGGSIALVGIANAPVELDLNVLVERETALIGCHAFIDELPEAVALLPSLAPQLSRLIDTEIGLDEVPAAYERLLAGQSKGLKTIIRLGEAAG
ncbi:MAG: alcohol dehydrogenase catalytic domain-containing protein [Mesorhizobium sp.]|nr:alcohol dehydrogenase catalytic domain-containing protein [Mesorhizobium sp.]MBL8578395.1 alcohol dehydrogenase catalytic domain-containing protein [Mesorhizobium sp.]